MRLLFFVRTEGCYYRKYDILSCSELFAPDYFSLCVLGEACPPGYDFLLLRYSSLPVFLLVEYIPYWTFSNEL